MLLISASNGFSTGGRENELKAEGNEMEQRSPLEERKLFT